jgi:hypothetical protein
VTLCVGCHKEESAKQARERAKKVAHKAQKTT